jgi:hypothetical protein
MGAMLLLMAILSNTSFAQERSKPLQIDFTASAESFAAATREYKDIWASEGARIVATMERATGLQFEPGPIRAVIYEGPSFSGFGERPMQLRASYPPATKRATLVHELGHRLMGDLVPRDVDHHSIIFLFVYDVWVKLWGQSFADEQVTVERARTGSLANYDKLWTEALALSAAERERRFKQFVQEHRKD